MPTPDAGLPGVGYVPTYRMAKYDICVFCGRPMSKNKDKLSLVKFDSKGEAVYVHPTCCEIMIRKAEEAGAVHEQTD